MEKSQQPFQEQQEQERRERERAHAGQSVSSQAGRDEYERIERKKEFDKRLSEAQNQPFYNPYTSEPYRTSKTETSWFAPSRIKPPRQNREPLTEEEKLRQAAMWLTIIVTVTLIYFGVTRFDGDAQIWSVIGALISAPILFRLFIGPLQIVVKIFVFCMLLALFGFIFISIAYGLFTLFASSNSPKGVSSKTPPRDFHQYVVNGTTKIDYELSVSPDFVPPIPNLSPTNSPIKNKILEITMLKQEKLGSLRKLEIGFNWDYIPFSGTPSNQERNILMDDYKYYSEWAPLLVCHYNQGNEMTKYQTFWFREFPAGILQNKGVIASRLSNHPILKLTVREKCPARFEAR